MALDGEYESASRELRTVCSITPTQFFLIEFGTYLHLSGNSGSACDQFNLAKKLSEDKNDLKNTCLSAFGAIRSVSMTPDNTDYLNLKNDLLLLYQKSKNYVSSVIINYFNVRDFYKWRNLKEKDDLALFFQNNSNNMPEGLSVPRGFILPLQEQELKSFQTQNHTPNIFIAKETGLFGGQGITLHSQKLGIPKNFSGVVQSYIENPLLVRGKKAHIRLYIIFLSYRPLEAYFWQNGIVRIAPEEYLPKKGWLSNPEIHITNTAINNWGLIPYIEHISGSLKEKHQIWSKLYKTASGFVHLLRDTNFFAQTAPIPNNSLVPKIIGFDALFDDNKKVWFLEIQRNPGQRGAGATNKINGTLYQNVFEMTLKTLERRLLDKEPLENHKSFIRI